jgi:hypothetical protein
MKKSLFTISLLLCFYVTMAQHGYSTVDADGNRVGRISLSSWGKTVGGEWFNAGYTNYEPNASALDALRKLPPGTTFIAFGGSWCEDTQKLLPQFIKVTDLCRIPRSSITVYFLSRNKTSPEGFESQYGIFNTPTFIILNNGREIGRITQNISSSMENDLVEISGVANK